VPDSITSGSIFPTKVFESCGLFEAALFIDAVDYEYCYRLKSRYGLSTIVFPDIVLKHEVGYPTKINLGLTTDNYTAFRTYFIIRNHITIWKRYPKLFQPAYKKTLIKIHITYRLAKIVIGEENKISKIRAIVIGMFHGFSGRTGYYKI
jgi:rhamnosyltransferase